MDPARWKWRPSPVPTNSTATFTNTCAMMHSMRKTTLTPLSGVAAELRPNTRRTITDTPSEVRHTFLGYSTRIRAKLFSSGPKSGVKMWFRGKIFTWRFHPLRNGVGTLVTFALGRIAPPWELTEISQGYLPLPQIAP